MSQPADRRTSLHLVGRTSLVVGLLLFGLIGVSSVLAGGEATSTVLETSGSPANFGDTVTFTATVTDTVTPANVPTGTVEFMDGATDLGPGVLDINGVATLDVSDLTAGTHSITADYLGADPNFDISNSAPVSQVINHAATATAVVSDGNPSVWSQNVTFTATVSSAGGTPTGSVEFMDGATDLGPGTLTSGTASLSTTSLPIGTHSITATYGDTTYFDGSDSSGAPVSQVVNHATSDTAITTDLSGDTVTGESYNVAFAVAGAGLATATPSGTVTIDDGTDSCGPISLVSGSGSCSLDSMTAGLKTITATYSGDSHFNGGSGTTSHTVNPDPTSASVSSDHHPSVHGQNVTFTASVSHNAPGSGIPTGTVTFMDGGSPFGSKLLNGAGQATLSISTLTTATHAVTVVYAGDGNYAGVTSPPFSQVVNQAATTTTVSSSVPTPPGPDAFGTSVKFTADVNVTSPGSGTPTGTVHFKDGSTIIGSDALDGAGEATFTTTILAVGGHAITAVYADDADFVGSTSAGITQTVAMATPTVSVSGSGSPSTYGDSVTFGATVTGTISTPTGTVTFKDGATPIGSAPLDGGGHASVMTSVLDVGSHVITAKYNGEDPDYTVATSPVLSGGQDVDPATLTVTAANKSRVYGAANPAFTVGYTGFVNGQNLATSGVSGSPTCSSAATPASAVAGSPYTISCSTGSLTATNYSFTFVSGQLTITKATSSTAVASDHNPSVFGQPVTFTATISGFGGGSASGNVDFIIDGGAPQTRAVSGNIATYTTSALAVGSYSVEADYGGDGNLTTSTDTLNTNQAVNKASSLTEITSDLSSATKVGASYSVAVSVTAVGPGAGTPSGTVNVSDGFDTCPITLSGGTGSCLLTSTTKGRPKTVTTSYTGDGSFAVSSDNDSHVVDAVPVAVADSYTAYEAGGSPNQLIVPAVSGVLANDTDADADLLTATNPSTPSHGTLVLSADGSFTYTPAALYVGPDAFTYTANDTFFDSTTATVSIDVQAVNQPPTFTLDTSTITVNENQFDSAADTITNKATLWSQGAGDSGQHALAYKVSSSVPGLLSQLGIDSGGTLSFKTFFGVPGTATISVQAVDSGGVLHNGVDTSAPQSFTIVVTYHNQQPFANGDVVQIGQSSSSNALDVLANDSPGPPDEQAGGGHPQTVSVASVTQPIDSDGHASGTAAIINGGSAIDFVPKPGFTCQLSTPTTPTNCVTFTYTIKDSGSPQGTSTPGTVFITVLASTSRLSGSDRYATDAAIVTGNYGVSSVVYVATGTGFADGLTGAAAAGTLHAPLILVSGQANAIPAVTKTALLDVIGPSTQIRVLGGTASISTKIYNLLSAMAPLVGGLPNIIRLADDTRYDTAVKVSQNSYPTTLASHSVFIASGLSYPDALAAAAAAGHVGAPLLLVPGSSADLSSVPKVLTELQRLAPTTVYIAGGTAVIVPSMRTSIQNALPLATLVPLSGANRYETATKIADQFFQNPAIPPFNAVPVGTVYIASGLNFPDALAGAALAGSQGAPILLVPGTSLNLDGVIVAGHKVILEELGMARLFPNRIVIFGGSGAVSNGIFNELAAIPRS